MIDLSRRIVNIELSNEEQQALVQYAIERLIEDEVQRRKTPALFQPKPTKEHHPTYHPL